MMKVANKVLRARRKSTAARPLFRTFTALKGLRGQKCGMLFDALDMRAAKKHVRQSRPAWKTFRIYDTTKEQR